MKNIQTFFAAAGVLILCSCSTTSVTSTWKASETVPSSHKKIMIVGIIREADRTIRQKMEEHLAGDLRELGYNSFSAYEVYGPKAFDNMSEETINRRLASDSVDAVLTVVLLDKQKERYYVRGRVVYSPYVTYYGRFWGYYRSIYTRIETPDYYEVSTKYFWESNSYDLHKNKLLYSVQTRSFEPAPANALAHEYGQKIIESMLHDKVIERQSAKTNKAM